MPYCIFMTKLLLTIFMFFMFISSAKADFAGPEVDNWDTETHVLLAQALVSEAGWQATTDHAAILWTLYRQWQFRRQANPDWTLRDQVHAYCAGFQKKVHHTKRHKWIHSLPTNGVDRPKHWPSAVSWTTHQEKWSKILEFSQSWYEGEIQDPCKGRAMHWGAPYGHDLRNAIRNHLKPVKCGNTRNLFWSPPQSRSSK